MKYFTTGVSGIIMQAFNTLKIQLPAITQVGWLIQQSESSTVHWPAHLPPGVLNRDQLTQGPTVEIPPKLRPLTGSKMLP